MDLDHSILFLEDINEAPYKIERFISQLYYSGSLQKVQGLILGEFYYKNELLNMKEILPVFASYFPKNIPILYQFPSGHGTKNQMLPIGCNITLTTNPNEIRSVNPNV